MTHAAIVYQAGIANVFELDRTVAVQGYRPVKRLAQGDFRTCEAIAQGLMLAGVDVAVYSCNVAGDVSIHDWTRGLGDCPFRDEARPPIKQGEHDANQPSQGL